MTEEKIEAVTEYRSYRIIEGKPRWIIIDDNGKITDKNPSKEKLRSTDISMYKRSSSRLKITDNELLEHLRQFYKENGRPPSRREFNDNPNYPNFATYQRHFGSWRNALKLAGLDVDTMVRKGILQNEYYKGRLFEIYVTEHFLGNSIDISGDNCHNSFDGICPKGQIYDAKSSSLIESRYWIFNLNSALREEIEWFYLGAFDKDYKNLLHVWRIPGDFTGDISIVVGLNNDYAYNIENMKEYEITDKFKDIDIL